MENEENSFQTISDESLRQKLYLLDDESLDLSKLSDDELKEWLYQSKLKDYLDLG